MDANQTRFQLVFGEADWFGDAGPDSPAAALEWRSSDATVSLKQKVFVFPTAPGAPVLSPADRRGAAQDHFGGYYWIGPSRDEILYLAQGQQQAQHFWSYSDLAGCPRSSTFGVFSPVTPAAARSYVLGGLAVTTDHYLLVGMTQPAGLLLFDLYAGAEPLEYRWPASIPFAPFAIAASPDGGAWDTRPEWCAAAIFNPLPALPSIRRHATLARGFKPIKRCPLRPFGPWELRRCLMAAF